MINVIMVSKQRLYEAMLQWELASRNGETLSPEEVAAKSVEQVAGESTELLWKLLSPQIGE